MGIHNSSILSTERRVVNHNTFKPNMKAFMTACAVLASSANADPQLFGNLVNLDQTVRHPGLIQPYNVVPLNHVSYAHTVNVPHPLGPVMTSVPSYSVAALPNHHFIKREAEPETPYEIKSKMENPVDGSEQEVQIKVDASGKGKSFQRVEQKDQSEVMRDNYILEHRRMAQRPLISKMYMAAQRGVDRNHQMGMNQMRLDRNQMGMDRNQMGVDRNQMSLDRNQMEMYRSKQQRLEDQMRIQQNREAMLVENMGQRNDQLRRQMAAHPRQTANNQQLGMNQMVQLINHNLKNAVESHSETGKNMMTALESHEELGQNLRDAIKLYESTPATLGSRRYSNMRDAMVMNNNQMVGHNMREGQMIHHQNQMIHPQNQMIHTQQMRI